MAIDVDDRSVLLPAGAFLLDTELDSVAFYDSEG